MGEHCPCCTGNKTVEGLGPMVVKCPGLPSHEAEVERLNTQLDALSKRLNTPVEQLREVADIELENARLRAKVNAGEEMVKFLREDAALMGFGERCRQYQAVVKRFEEAGK